jgi:hypothetical protein
MRRTVHTLRFGRPGKSILLGLLLTSSAFAQYNYDPAAADEQQPGIRYFGSAKDDRGSLLPGVSILIDSRQAAYVFVTDEQGRFHGNLPLDLGPDLVTPKCFKVGFQLVRVNKRPGPQGPKPTVQVDCVLRAGS